MRSVIKPVWLVLIALLVLGGCGGEDNPRYELSGRVAYEGEPLPAGALLLEPDTSRGNQGPGTMVIIQDGKYVTERGKGTVGGPHIARITGYDGKQPSGAEAELKPMGELLVGPVEFHIDLPKAASTYDFNIPPPG